jgi:hypothetical protein
MHRRLLLSSPAVGAGSRATSPVAVSRPARACRAGWTDVVSRELAFLSAGSRRGRMTRGRQMMMG